MVSLQLSSISFGKAGKRDTLYTAPVRGGKNFFPQLHEDLPIFSGEYRERVIGHIRGESERGRRFTLTGGGVASQRTGGKKRYSLIIYYRRVGVPYRGKRGDHW